MRAIIGNKVAAGLLDRYLAEIGYRAQQTDQAEDPHRPDNLWAPVEGDHGLWAPVEGDHGAHGPFDSIARAGGTQLWMSKPRAAVALAIASLAVSTVAAWSLRRGGAAHEWERLAAPRRAR